MLVILLSTDMCYICQIFSTVRLCLSFIALHCIVCERERIYFSQDILPHKLSKITFLWAVFFS
jgi:hypothetical protein